MEKKEEWKDIEGYDGLYQISSHGRIKSFHKYKNGKLLKATEDDYGYLFVTLAKSKKTTGIRKVTPVRIHRLVAFAFIPNPKNLPIINHLNSKKTINKVDNLEWCTYRENNTHFHRTKNIELPTGVSKTKSGTRFEASCYYNQKNKYLGTFDTPEEAGLAYTNFLNQII